MRNIPDRVKRRLKTLVKDGELERNTVKRILQSKKARKIDYEIGDIHSDDFQPQFKTKHWDNEVNFSARLVVGDGVVTQHNNKLAYNAGVMLARFYEKDTGDEDGGFEFDVLLPKKPESNVLTWTIRHKGLDFFYQPELTEKEKANGARRPENVVGSYAVYHKTGRNNRVGGNEYRTGKAFHIYRPYAEDRDGNRVWCELNIDIDKNLMTITTPEDYLQTAKYPVIVDPTFGYTAAGGTLSAIARHDTSPTFYRSGVVGNRFTSPTGAFQVDSFHAYLGGNTSKATDYFYMLNSNPGEVLEVSEEVLGSNLSSTGWRTDVSSGSIPSNTTVSLLITANPQGYTQGVDESGVYYDVATVGLGGFYDDAGTSSVDGDTAYAAAKALTPSYLSFFNLATSIYITYSASATTGQPRIKLAGTFTQKPLKYKTGGSFVEKPVKIKAGGSFVEAQ